MTVPLTSFPQSIPNSKTYAIKKRVSPVVMTGIPSFYVLEGAQGATCLLAEAVVAATAAAEKKDKNDNPAATTVISTADSAIR